jgi:hypothetical protein
MKKQLASLTAAFALAVGLSAPAQAQTVPVHAPVYHTPTAVYAPQASSTYVSQRDINEVAQALGVTTIYPGAGKGFTSGIVHRSGNHIGLEYNLNNNGTATVVRAYNLDNFHAQGQFNAAMQNAAHLDLASRSSLHDFNRRVQPVYRPNAVDVIAAVGLIYIAHEAINNNHKYRNDHRYYAPPPRNHHPRHPPPRHHNPRHR